MGTETVSFLKKHAADLPLEEPMVITQNGKPIYVVESYEERIKRDQAIALLKLTSLSTKDMEEGKVISSDEMKNRLDSRKAK